MPGKQLSRRPKKLSDYAIQLQEKQKIRRVYGLREKQFRLYYGESIRNRAQTGEVLLGLLERRLDNVLYRSGFALSREHARQLINHRHFIVNGRRVGIPSQLVNAGDVIKPHQKDKNGFRAETSKQDWLKVNRKTAEITVTRLPRSGELPIEFDTQKIIEFYSR